MFKVAGLNYALGRRSVLQDINFESDAPEIIGVLGENGVGKTTLMRLIVGAVLPKKGAHITLDGLTGDALKSAVAFIPNLNWVRKRDTISDVLAFYRAGYPDFNQERWTEVNKTLRLNEQDQVSALSKGMLERLIFALTVSRDAKVFMLDEPFSGVDVLTRRKLLQTLIQWVPEDATILMSTHEIAEIEPVVDRVLILKDAHIIVDQTIDDIRDNEHMTLEQYYVQRYVEDNGGIEL